TRNAGSKLKLVALIGHCAYERVEGVWGNREVPPQKTRRRGFDVGETWLPPRERAEGERRSRGGDVRRVAQPRPQQQEDERPERQQLLDHHHDPGQLLIGVGRDPVRTLVGGIEAVEREDEHGGE